MWDSSWSSQTPALKSPAVESRPTHDFTMIRYRRVLLAAKTPVQTSVSESFIVVCGRQHHSCSQTNKASSHRWSDFQTQVHCWWKQVRALCSTVSISKASVLRSWAEWLFGQRFSVMKFSSCYASSGQQMWRGRCGLLSCLVSDVFFGNSPLRENTVCVCVCLCVQRPRVEFMSLSHSGAPIERSPLQSD